MPRNMTDEERRRFEEQTLHHGEGEEPPDLPASEANVIVDVDKTDADREPDVLPPNPD